MCDITEEQINCVFETEAEVPIFDQDNWVSEEESKKGASNKNIIMTDKAQNQDPQLMKKINKELEESKDNFFKVKVVKKEKVKKQNTSMVKGLKKIENDILEKNPHTVLKQGYMEKRTDSFIFRWKTRYFALTSQKLYFFQDNKKDKVVGCVNLKIIPAQLKKQDNQITLDFAGETQNMVLRCENKKQCQEWLNLLGQVIKYQSKEKKFLLKTLVKPLYGCTDSISEKEFFNTAETGDILLFYTKNTGAKIQRMITNSDFDHVAMVVKFRHNEPMVFESNQSYGVSIFDWGQYVRYFNLYQKICIRKLVSVRKEQMHHTLLNFVKKNLGKKYDINAMKLLKFESDFNWDQVNQQETRGFFCSELVAKAYKTVGLVDQKKSSGRYWPVDFSEKGSLELKNGAYLGPQQSIILKKHIKNII